MSEKKVSVVDSLRARSAYVRGLLTLLENSPAQIEPQFTGVSPKCAGEKMYCAGARKTSCTLTLFSCSRFRVLCRCAGEFLNFLACARAYVRAYACVRVKFF